jgi:hypothetical protein
MILLAISGCASSEERARLAQDNDILVHRNKRLERIIEQRNDTIAQLKTQVENLKGLGADRPADLYAPVRLDIASLSGGADYDGVPGDDGVTVYLRPRDADGDVVKVPGRITIQLLDNSDLASPRVLDVRVFDDPEKLGTMWYSRFGTNHYTLKCPFQTGSKPHGRLVTVSVEFVDFLTGRVLTVAKEVAVSVVDE